MNKLEEKLIDLGYYQVAKIRYEKFYKSTHIVIGVNSKTKQLYGRIKNNFSYIEYDYQMKELQQAYNKMKEDLEELKEYED